MAVGHGTGRRRLARRRWAHAAPLDPGRLPGRRWLAPGADRARRDRRGSRLRADLPRRRARADRGARRRLRAGRPSVPAALQAFARRRRRRSCRSRAPAGRCSPSPTRGSRRASRRWRRSRSRARAQILRAARRLRPARRSAGDPGVGRRASLRAAGPSESRRADERRSAGCWRRLRRRSRRRRRSTPAAELERSLAVGAGLAAPDLRWALGHAWRALYPALVTRLGDGGLAGWQWPAFRALAAEMERVAFGPPPVNAAKLLALIDAGRVDLDPRGGRAAHRRAGGRRRSAGAHGERRVDVVVDAVLPAARRAALRQRPARATRRRRPRPHRAAGGAGSRSTPDARLHRRATGAARPGLSAIGRPTEDSVIGNDTLSRTLHPHADRWARRVVGRARASRARPGRTAAQRELAAAARHPAGRRASGCEGVVALPRRLEPWQLEVLRAAPTASIGWLERARLAAEPARPVADGAQRRRAARRGARRAASTSDLLRAQGQQGARVRRRGAAARPRRRPRQRARAGAGPRARRAGQRARHDRGGQAGAAAGALHRVGHDRRGRQRRRAALPRPPRERRRAAPSPSRCGSRPPRRAIGCRRASASDLARRSRVVDARGRRRRRGCGSTASTSISTATTRRTASRRSTRRCGSSTRCASAATPRRSSTSAAGSR